MRRRPTILEPRDLGVLTLTRVLLESRGPMGDAELVETIEKNAIPALEARESLARLEAARALRFGPSGWQIERGSQSMFALPAGGW